MKGNKLYMEYLVGEYIKVLRDNKKEIKKNAEVAFYGGLKKKLKDMLRKEEKLEQEALEYYQMKCRGRMTNFYFSVFTLFIAILALCGEATSNWQRWILIILTIVILVASIVCHIKDRIKEELAFVLAEIEKETNEEKKENKENKEN